MTRSSVCHSHTPNHPSLRCCTHGGTGAPPMMVDGCRRAAAPAKQNCGVRCDATMRWWFYQKEMRRICLDSWGHHEFQGGLFCLCVQYTVQACHVASRLCLWTYSRLLRISTFDRTVRTVRTSSSVPSMRWSGCCRKKRRPGCRCSYMTCSAAGPSIEGWPPHRYPPVVRWRRRWRILSFFETFFFFNFFSEKRWGPQ